MASMGPSRTAQPPFDSFSHEHWWGTDEAQQQLGRTLIEHMAKKLMANPDTFRWDLPQIKDYRGDLSRLNPELKVALALGQLWKSIHQGYNGCLAAPIDVVPEPLKTNDHLAVHNRDAFEIIQQAIEQAMAQKQRLLEVPPDYRLKPQQKAALQDKQKASVPRWQTTWARWRDFQARCVAGEMPQARQRPRLRS